MEKKNKKNPLKVVSLEKVKNEGVVKSLKDLLTQAEDGDITNCIILALTPQKNIVTLFPDKSLYGEDSLIFIGLLEKLKHNLLSSEFLNGIGDIIDDDYSPAS